MSKANIKRSPSKRIICISAFVLVIVMLALGISYAWFRHSIEIPGINMHTGTFDYQFVGMHRDQTNGAIVTDFAYSTQVGPNSKFDFETQTGFNPIPDINGLSVVSDVSVIATPNENETAELFYIVSKVGNSIDLDVSVSLDASLTALHDFNEPNAAGTQVELDASDDTTPDSDSAVNVIGGFWYSVANVTDTADGIEAIKQYVANSENFNGDVRTEPYFPNIRNEVVTAELDEDNFWCFRLSYGLHNGANLKDYTGKSVNISASLCVAQKGGLPGNEKASTHYVKTLEQFKTALLEYRPNDRIIISGDIDYLGDLIINRPVDLQIVNSTLTVHGDMRFVYASRGSFILNTSSAGHLKIRKMDGIDAGGNLYCDIPDSSLELLGFNSAEPEMADVYIEGNFSADVDERLGLVITRSRISDLSEALKTIILRQDSRIDVASRTTVGTIRVPNDADIKMNAIRVQIINMGTIEEIDLSSMTKSLSLAYRLPRIFIDNFGKIERNGTPTPIKLPPWASKWSIGDPEYPTTTDQIDNKNTRIIHEAGAGDMSVVENPNQNFKSSDIEQGTIATLVDKDPADPTKITVHYMESDLFTNPDGNGGTVGTADTTLQNIIEYYVNTDDAALKIPPISDITSMKVICYGDVVLTPADYAYIHTSMTNISTLDLRDAVSENKTVPDNAFSGMTKLTELYMPDEDLLWGENIFVNTGVDEIRLPTKLTGFNHAEGQLSKSLTGIKYLHVENKSNIVLRDIGVDAIDDIYLFCLTEDTRAEFIAAIQSKNNMQLTSYKGDLVLSSSNSSIADVSADRINLEKISKIFLDGERYGDYYARIIGDACEIITYVGEEFNPQDERNDELVKHEDGNVYRFDFSTFTINHDEYDITRFDDFAFFGHSLANLGSDTLTFGQYLNEIGDAAFYDVSLPKNVNLGGCKTLGHKALAFNTTIKILEAPYVETMGFYACGGYANGGVELLYFPRAIWGSGEPFGITDSLQPNRVHIGMMQTDTDDHVAVKSDYNKIHLSNGPTTVFWHTLNAPANLANLIPFNSSAPYYRFVNENYVATVRDHILGGNANRAPKSLGTYTADDVVFMADDRYQGAYAYLPIEGTEDEYKLIQCMYQPSTTLGALDKVYTVPAYVDKDGVKHNTTVVGTGAYHYATLNASTLTFDDSFKTVENSAFYNYDNRKLYNVLDLHNVETIKATNAFGGNNIGAPMFSLVAPNLKTATKTGNYGVFENCKQLRIASVPKLQGRTDRLFRGCERLEMASIGPITGEYLFFGHGTGVLKTVFVDVSSLEGNKPDGNAYLDNNTYGVVDFSVISIGGEYSWEKSANSPYKAGVVDPYATVIVDEGLNTIRFSDWTAKTAIDGTRNFTYYLPTFLYAIQTDDQETVSLEIAIDFAKVENQASFTVPSEIYLEKVEEGVDPTVTDILGNNTPRYTFDAAKAADAADVEWSIVEIGDRVFEKKLINVESITFPASLKRIGKSAFAECKLKALEIKGNGALIIDNRAFYKTTMDSLTITGVESIGESAFEQTYKYDGTDIKQHYAVSLDDKIVSIGAKAFSNSYLSSIGTTHKLADNLQLNIGESAFESVTSPDGGMAVSFGEALVVVDKYAFNGANISTLSMENMSVIKEDAFRNAKIYGTVDFSASAGTIEPHGFVLSEIATVELGSGTTLKGDYAIGADTAAFNKDNVVYKGAFTDCTIGTFNFASSGAIAPEALAFVRCSFENLNFGGMQSLTTNAGVGATDYAAANNNAYTWYDAEGNPISNLDYTRHIFRGCTSLGHVDLGKINTLGSYALSGGAIEENITLSVKSIKQENKTTLDLLKTLEAYALNHIKIEDAVTVGENVTYNSSGLTFVNDVEINQDAVVGLTITNGDLTIGNNATIGSWAFYPSKNNLTITKGNLVIGDMAAIGQSSFQGAKLYDGTITIGNGISAETDAERLIINQAAFDSSQSNGLTVGDFVKFGGDSVFNSSKIYGNASFGDYLTARGYAFNNATITGDLKFGTNFYKTNNNSITNAQTKINGNLIFGDSANLERQTISDATIGKSIIFGNNVTLRYYAVILSSVGEDFIIGDNVTFDETGGKNIVSTVTVGGDFTVGTNADFGSTSSAHALYKVTVDGDLEIKEGATFNSESICDSTLKGDFTLGDNATLNGTAQFLRTNVNGTFSLGSCSIQYPSYSLFTGSNYKRKYTINRLEFRDSFDGNIKNGGVFRYMVINELDLANVDSIGSYTFAESTIGSIENAALTTIGDAAFYLTSIKSAVNFGDVTTIGISSFNDATASGNLSFGNVTTVSDKAFRLLKLGSNDLTFNSIGTVNARAFDLTSAGDVTLNSVGTIKTNAFSGGEMTSLTINNVTTIENEAFAYIPPVQNADGTVTAEVPGVKVTGTVSITGVTGATMGASAFKGTTLGSIVEGQLTGGVTINGIVTLPESAFQSATINGNVGLGNTQTLSANSFNSAVIAGNFTAQSVTLYASAFENAKVGTEGKQGTGNMTFGSNVSFNVSNGNRVFYGATIYGNVDLSGVSSSLRGSAFENAVIYGKLDLKNLKTISSTSAFENAKLYGEVDLTSLTTISGNKTFGGANAVISEPLIFGSNVTVSNTSFIDLKDEDAIIIFNGDLNVTKEGAFNGVEIGELRVEGVATFANNATTAINIGSLNLKGGATIGEKAFMGAMIGPATFTGTTTVNALAFDGAKLGATTFNGGAQFNKNAFAGATVDGNLTFNGGATLDEHALFKNETTTGQGDCKWVTVHGDVKFHADADIGNYAFDRAQIDGDLWFYRDEENPQRTNIATVRDGAFYYAKIKGDLHFASGTLGPISFKYATIGVVADTSTNTPATGHIYWGNLTDVHGGKNADNGAFNSAVINGGVNFEDVSGLHYCIFRDVSHIPYINTGAVTSFGIMTTGEGPHENNASGRVYSVFSGIGSIGRLEMPNVVSLGRRTFTKITINEMAPFENLTTINGAFGDGVKIKSDLIFKKHITTTGSSSLPVFYGTSSSSTSFSGNVKFMEGLTAGTRITFAEMTIGGDLYINRLNIVGTLDEGYSDALMAGVTIGGKFTVATGDVVGIISRNKCHINGGISFPDDGTDRRLTVYENQYTKLKAFDGDNTVIKGTVDLSGIKEITNGFFYGVEFDPNTTILLPKAYTVGENAFRETNIVGAEMPFATTVGEHAFSSANKLANVVMPAVTEIENGAFEGCTAITSIHTPDLITLGENAFKGCNHITSVYVPKLATINAGAFEGCSALKAIDLPALVSFVGTSPFTGCNSLKVVFIGSQLTTWGEGAFAIGNNSSLERVVIRTVPSQIALGSYIMLPNANVKIALTDALEVLYNNAVAADGDGIIFGDATHQFGIRGGDQLQDYEFIIDGTGMFENLKFFVNRIETASGPSNSKIEIVDMEFVDKVNSNQSFTFPDELTADNVTYDVVSVGSDAMRAIKENSEFKTSGNKGITITLPAKLEFINFDGRDVHTHTSTYVVVAGNSNFMTVNGILYSASGDTLVLCPPNLSAEHNATSLTLTGPNANSQLIIAPNAFAGLSSEVENLTFMQSLVIGDNAFLDCNDLLGIYLTNPTNSIFIGKNTFTGCNDNLKVYVNNVDTAKNFVIYDTDVIDRFKSINEVS